MAGIMITLIDATARRPRDGRDPEPARDLAPASSPRPLRSGRPPRHHHDVATPSPEPDRTQPAC